MSAPNYETVDRIICAIEKQIEGKEVIDVQTVKTILNTLRDLNSYLAQVTYANYDHSISGYDEE